MAHDFLLEDDFEKFLVSEYFKHGSIDQVLKIHHFDIPISYAGYHRVLNKFGIIKSAGPNSKLSESLYLLSLIANYKIPLEKIYRKYAPASIKVSTNTIHRILHYTRLGLTRRQGVALLIENKDKPGQYLTGNDVSLTKTVLGNKGDLSLPMGHSKTGEDPRIQILRVLQQEVFTDFLINGNFPTNLVPEHPKPVMYINIADIRVSVYCLKVSPRLSFSSYKLQNISFKTLKEIKGHEVRPGVVEIVKNYEDILTGESTSEALEINSNLNTSLFAYAKIGSK
jgi:hypothetical protein